MNGRQSCVPLAASPSRTSLISLRHGRIPMWSFAFSSPMFLSMFQGPPARKTFVVACKKCRRDLPTGAAKFPFQSIVVECPLWEKRRYLPSEVFLGLVDQLVNRQKRAGAI
jgi:hypothetical protein